MEDKEKPTQCNSVSELSNVTAARSSRDIEQQPPPPLQPPPPCVDGDDDPGHSKDEFTFEQMVSIAAWIRDELRERTTVTMSLIAVCAAPASVCWSGSFRAVFLEQRFLGCIAVISFAGAVSCWLLAYHFQESLQDIFPKQRRASTKYVAEILDAAGPEKAAASMASILASYKLRLHRSDAGHCYAFRSLLLSLVSLTTLAVMFSLHTSK